MYPHEEDVSDFYGRPGCNQVSLDLPYKMKLSWNPQVSVSRMQCHKKIVKPLKQIFADTLEHYGIEEIRRLRLDLLGGCLNVRKKRGGDSMSMHAWGIAVDIDPDNNCLGWNHERATLAGPSYYAWWEIVEKHGALSLGRVRDYDWMHFQFARLT